MTTRPIQLWISNDRRFLPGDRAKVQVRTKDDGYLIVFHVDPDGHLRVLFPLDPDKDNFVRGGKKYEVRGRGGRESFEADGKGRGTVYAAVSRDPFRFEGFVLDDHWDYRALAPCRLSTNPEPELNELVRRMAQGQLRLRHAQLRVVERWSMPRTTHPATTARCTMTRCYRYPAAGRTTARHTASPSACFSAGPIGVTTTTRTFTPTIHSTIRSSTIRTITRRSIVSRCYLPALLQLSLPESPNDDAWYRGRNNAYTPYRFRGTDGSPLFRDRNVVRQAVNTVYLPPISPVREPATSNPVRRIVEGRRQELQTQQPRDGGAQRSTVDDARRVLDRPIEAHRRGRLSRSPVGRLPSPVARR